MNFTGRGLVMVLLLSAVFACQTGKKLTSAEVTSLVAARVAFSDWLQQETERTKPFVEHAREHGELGENYAEFSKVDNYAATITTRAEGIEVTFMRWPEGSVADGTVVFLVEPSGKVKQISPGRDR
jgi:hypothetical protein